MRLGLMRALLPVAGISTSSIARNVFHRSFGIIIEDEAIQGP